MGRAATELLETSATGAAELWLVPAIVAEVVFVLSKVYGRPRLAVADALLELIENPGIILFRFQDETNSGKVSAWQDHVELIQRL